MRRLRPAVLAAFTVLLAGCDWYYREFPSVDYLWHTIPWFDHMVAPHAVYPYQSAAVPRNTPAGTVPVTGGEPSWEADWTGGNFAIADPIRNPYVAALPTPPGASGPRDIPAAVLQPGPSVPMIPGTMEARGDTLYQVYCTVCHGLTGAGDGPVSSRVGAPSIITPRAAAYSDGYLYSIIRYGRGVMPRYGDKVFQPRDRWAIVNHVRMLQRGGTTVAQPGAAPTAGEQPGTPPPAGTGAAGAPPTTGAPSDSAPAPAGGTR